MIDSPIRNNMIMWCERIMMLSVCVTVFFIPFSIAALEITFMVMLSAWVVKRAAQGSWKFHSTVLNGPLLVWTIVVMASVIFSQTPALSLTKFFTKFLQDILTFFFIVETVNSRRKLCVLIWVFLLSVSLVVFDGVYQLTHAYSFIFHMKNSGRLTGPLRHANDFGAYLVMAIPVACCAWVLCRPSLLITKRFFLIALVLTMAVFLGLTYSRGAWLAFSVSCFLLMIIQKSIKLKVWIIFFLTAFMTVFSFSLIHNRTDIGKSYDSEIFLNMSDRNRYWKDAFNMSKQYPLFGCGYNAYIETLKKKRNPLQEYPHNCYLHIAAETGFTGLAVFLWFLITFFRQASILPARLPEPIDRNIAIGFLIGVAAFFVHSGVDTAFSSIQLSTFAWFMMAVITAMSVHKEFRSVSLREAKRRSNP